MAPQVHHSIRAVISDTVKPGSPWYFAIIESYVTLAPKTDESMLGEKSKTPKFWWRNAKYRNSKCHDFSYGFSAVFGDQMYLSSGSHPDIIANRVKGGYLDPASIETYPGSTLRLSQTQYASGLVPQDRNYYASGICVDYYRVDSIPSWTTSLTLSNSPGATGISYWNMPITPKDLVNGRTFQHDKFFWCDGTGWCGIAGTRFTSPAIFPKHYKPTNMWMTP